MCNVADDYLVSERPAVPIFTARDPLILLNKELGCQSESFGTHLKNTRCYIAVDLTFNTYPQKRVHILVTYGTAGCRYSQKRLRGRKLKCNIYVYNTVIHSFMPY